MNARFRTAFFLTLALIFLSASLDAYVPIRWGRSGLRVFWSSDRFPLAFLVSEKTAQGTPNLAAGSDPLAALKAGMAAWQDVPTASIRFADLRTTVLESSNGEDGINLITMADTSANRSLLGADNDTGILALTRLVFNVNTGRMIESDIIINSRYQFSTNLAPGTYDLQSVVTHELGHALGCDHAVAQNDTMFYQIQPGEFFQRNLSVDSAAFATTAYPATPAGDLANVFTGKVTQGEKGVFGASVSAVELNRNLIYTALTEPDGTFTMPGPVLGEYALYVEPLDGPVKAEHFIGSSTADSYYQNIKTDFRTSFEENYIFSAMKSESEPTAIRSREVRFDLSLKPATLNIDRLGRGEISTGSGYLSNDPVIANQGETFNLFIAGSETWKASGVEAVRFLGEGIILDPTSALRVIRNVSGNAVGISVQVSIAQNAAPGPRTVLLKVGEEQVAGTGGIIVAPRSLPVVTLYMPYMEVSPTQYTGIALANPSQSPAAIRVVARDNTGTLVYDRDAVVPSQMGIGAGEQTAKLVSQILNLPPTAQQTGSLVIETDATDVQGFFLSGDFAGNYLDGGTAFRRGFAELYFLDILQNSNTATEIHLMNVKEYPLEVQLSLVDASGTIMTRPIQVTIPAHGKIGDSVSNLFSMDFDINSAHVRATASEDGLAGFGLIRQRDTIFGMNAQTAESGGSLLYSPHMAVGDFGVRYDTRLNVVNVGDAGTEIKIALIADNGETIVDSGSRFLIPIGPGGQLSVDLQSFFGLDPGAMQGSIRVTASAGARLLANVIFGNGNPAREALSFGAALVLSPVGARKFMFSQVTQGQDFYTGLAFLAPDGANISIEVHQPDGTIAGSQDLSLGIGARTVALLQDLVAGSKDQVGGYVKVTASQPVVSFELFGATNGRFLSAVPPQKLPD